MKVWVHRAPLFVGAVRLFALTEFVLPSHKGYS
jgi:hypothetical protein